MQEKISTLMCGGLEKANKHDAGVEVVHGCLTEGGDSILGVFFCDPLRAKTSNKFLG